MLTKPDRLARFERVFSRLASSSDHEDVEIAQQFLDWLESGAVVPLDTALGLRSRGGVSVRRALLIEDRNRHLRALARDHHEWAGLDPVIVAGLMRTAFERYEASRWLRDRASGLEPPSEPAATFWRLLSADQSMPKLRQLRAILCAEIQYPV